MNLNWEAWFYGIFAAGIGGAATAGGAWLGMAGAKAAGLDVPTLNWQALGVILTSGALTNLFFYLKQSPMPAIEVSKTTIVEKTIEKTQTTPVEPPKV